MNNDKDSISRRGFVQSAALAAGALRARRKITFTIENVWGERRVGGASNSILGSAGAV